MGFSISIFLSETLSISKMNKLLSINQWSRLDKTLEQRPNVLLSQFAIIAMAGCIVQVINDAYWLSPNGVIMDSTVFAVFLFAYILNERGNHLISKLIFVFFGAGILFVYAALIPKTSAVFFVFFPFVTVTFLIFSNEEKKYKYTSIGYVVLLLFVLEITDYQTFGEINITEGVAEPSSYYVNLAISMFVLIFSMYNIDVINLAIEQKKQRAEDELHQKNADLMKANEELDYFVYSASHDLKAPLSSILGLINVAKYDVKDDTTLDFFDRIEKRVQRLTVFIKEVIELSRNTRTNVEHAEVALKPLIMQVIESGSYLDFAQDINFQIDVDSHSVFLLDKSRMEVILNNLVSNAIKYQVADRKTKEVRISAHECKGFLTLSVEDNGCGIAPDQLEKVFGMFYRGEQSREGSGLGLYIVKNIVEKLNGEITLKSRVNEGTRIDIYIPLQKNKPEPMGQSVLQQ